MTPVPIKDIYRPSAGEITVLRHGGGGDACRFVCGFLHSDQRFGPLLDTMPALTCVRMRDGALHLDAFTDTEMPKPITLSQDPRWWQAAIDHLVGETAKPGPGNRAVLARLSELLFMEVVRWQLTDVRHDHSGWLAGLNDKHVGRALSLICTPTQRAPGPWRSWRNNAASQVQRSPSGSSISSATRPCSILTTAIASGATPAARKQCRPGRACSARRL